MKTLIIILLFGKTILLTPNPISIDNDAIVLKLSEPISAITKGASIQIEVTSMLSSYDVSDVIEAQGVVKELFPEGTISASLNNDDDDKVVLSYDGGILYNRKHTRLSLYSDDMPTKIKWDNVTIRSEVELIDVLVLWRNHTK